jgi:hypothetical protein
MPHEEDVHLTPDQERKHDELKRRSALAAERLQRIADALGDAAYLREFEMQPDKDESELIRAWEHTLKRIDEITDEEERLLKEAGILPE